MDHASRRTRREFIQGFEALGLALTVGCSLPFAGAPRAPRMRRIARLLGTQPNPQSDSQGAAFRESMSDLGYIEGQNLLIEERSVTGDEHIAEPAAEMVRLQAEVILVVSFSAARA